MGSGQAQKLLAALARPQGRSDGQTSPTGADDAAPSTAAQPAPQSAGRQFASATLASLLSLQEQPASQTTTDLAASLIGQLDSDGDGALGADEIASALDVPADDPALSSAIAKLDSDGDGKLGSSELAAGLGQLAQAHHHHAGRHGRSGADLAAGLVGAGDADGDGALSASEIGSELSSAGFAMSTTDLDAAVAKLDSDGDGKLDASELAAAIDARRKSHDGPSAAAADASTSTAAAATATA